MNCLTFVGAERFFPTFVHVHWWLDEAIPIFPANVSDGDSQTTKGFPRLPENSTSGLMQLETYGIIQYPRQKRTYLGIRCEK